MADGVVRVDRRAYASIAVTTRVNVGVLRRSEYKPGFRRRHVTRASRETCLLYEGVPGGNNRQGHPNRRTFERAMAQANYR